MFGKNPIRSITRDANRLAVEEMFYTIQGEGPYTGRPCVFIRMAGCNLACTFCDTQFETQAEKPRFLPELVKDFLARFSEQERGFVVLTGGEPLRQNIVSLVEQLVGTGTELIQIETAGTVWPAGLDLWIRLNKVVLVCSPKTPQVNIKIRDYCTHWKYIIKAGPNEVSESDGLPARGTQVSTVNQYQLIYRGQGTIWLSPCDEYDAAKNKANMELARDLCLKYGYRMSLQTHKIIGVA